MLATPALGVLINTTSLLMYTHLQTVTLTSNIYQMLVIQLNDNSDSNIWLCQGKG